MTRILGVVIILASLYGTMFAVDARFATNPNVLKEILNEQAYFGILTLGVGLLIISGGIDLSIGSVIALSAVLFGVLIRDGFSPILSAAMVITLGVAIGTVHGLLVTRLKLQAFLVTLCGLFVYRGVARVLSKDRFGIQTCIEAHPEHRDQLDTMSKILTGRGVNLAFEYATMIFLLIGLALIIGFLLHGSVYGRYWYAIGRNEQAARYAGINVNRQKISVYIICSTLAALGGILVFMDKGSVTPETTGETWELYAITGAVLGGCSLRGGEGTVPGMVLGAAVLPLLQRLISRLGNVPEVRAIIPSIDPVIPILIGLTLLAGTIADEFFRRQGQRKKG